LDSLLSQIASDSKARWPATAESTPSPRPTPKPRLVYAPAPAFPPGASLPGLSGTGRFRLSFDAQGNVTNIQLIQSTGNGLFDESAIRTLRQWKCSPGEGGVVTVPVTFRTQ
jgi:TonB family protein